MQTKQQNNKTKYSISVIKSAWRRIKRPSRKTITELNRNYVPIIIGLIVLGSGKITAETEDTRQPFTPYDSEGYLDPRIEASWNGAYTCPGHVHFTVVALGAGLYPAAVALEYLNVIQFDALNVTPYAQDNCSAWVRGQWDRTTGTWPDIHQMHFIVTLAKWGSATNYQWIEIPWHADLIDEITPICDGTDHRYDVNLGSHYVNVGCGDLPRSSPTPRPTSTPR